MMPGIKWDLAFSSSNKVDGDLRVNVVMTRVILVMCVTHLTNTFVLPKVTSLRNWRSSSSTLFIVMTDKNVVLHVFFPQEYNIGSSSYKNSRIQDWSFVLQEHRSTALEVLTRTQEHKTGGSYTRTQEHGIGGSSLQEYNHNDLVPSSALPPWKLGHVNWEIILYLAEQKCPSRFLLETL